jgi:hypothetical protein
MLALRVLRAPAVAAAAATAAPGSAAGAAAAAATTFGSATGAARKATFFDLALAVRHWGVGLRLGRATWLRYPDSYITVTTVKPTKV